MKNPGQMLSMGYGFIQFKTSAHANEALKVMQHKMIDGRFKIPFCRNRILFYGHKTSNPLRYSFSSSIIRYLVFIVLL